MKRARSGATYVARKPTFEDRQFSAAQLEHQRRFRAAAAYAKQAAKTEPIYAALAKKTGQPAYNMALSDALHPPKIVAVEQSNGLIRVCAEDKVKVARVVVTVLDASGQTLAEGEATPDAAGWWWTFEAGDLNAARTRVQAWDLPGNIASWEEDWH